MLVDVRTETTTNTPSDATLVRCSVLPVLNRVERLSALQKKTCFNPSKGGRFGGLSQYPPIRTTAGVGGKVTC